MKNLVMPIVTPSHTIFIYCLHKQREQFDGLFRGFYFYFIFVGFVGGTSSPNSIFEIDKNSNLAL
jgi:hypothetical protein